MIVHTPHVLTLSCAMLVSTAASAEDRSESRVEVRVRSSSGDGNSTERVFRKVTKDGVVVEEHGDPHLVPNGGAAIDEAELARSVDVRVREMMERLMREAREGKPAEGEKSESKSGSSKSESSRSEKPHTKKSAKQFAQELKKKQTASASIALLQSSKKVRYQMAPHYLKGRRK